MHSRILLASLGIRKFFSKFFMVELLGFFYTFMRNFWTSRTWSRSFNFFPTLDPFSINSGIASNGSFYFWSDAWGIGVMHGASLSLHIIILLEMCLENILMTESVKTKLISLAFRWKNEFCQLVFYRSLRMFSIFADWYSQTALIGWWTMY